jgi:amino acid transporter
MAHQAVTKPIGLAVFASDALSSTAYATQEVLIILSLAVAGATWAGTGSHVYEYAMGIAIGISVLLWIVTVSYRQTIYAYPNGGGAYIVARDNLGETPAQIAGAALMTDYILTVAVSISAGVSQITSAFPQLFEFRVFIAVGIIAFMTVVNLRGVKESGRIFAVPTYFFLAIMSFTLLVGLYRYFSNSLGVVGEIEFENHHLGEPLQAFGLFLFLRAFSSGCTALTGIEAISNGITAFKDPKSHNAATTLLWMSSILVVLFLAITFLALQIKVLPSENPTVIAQMAAVIHGQDSLLYFATLAGTALILLMAANTAYADFPRLAALHAGDGFLPRQLTYKGSRLVFSWGIMVLAAAASALVIIMQASTTALIPLYAVGVFLSFTISQTGMVVRMQKVGKLKPGEKVKGMETTLEYDPHWRKHQLISAVGAVCTGVVMIVFAATKFMDGAWFVVILIPILVFIFFRIHHHYQTVAYSLGKREGKLESRPRKAKTLILVADVHAETLRMINFARALGGDWEPIHVQIMPERTARTQEKWAQLVEDHLGPKPLTIIDSPYRSLAEPVKQYIKELREKDPEVFIHIIMGQLVMSSFWEQFLHQNSVVIFNIALSQLKNVAVTIVPYQIEAQPDEVIDKFIEDKHQEALNGGEEHPSPAH